MWETQDPPQGGPPGGCTLSGGGPPGDGDP